ncbi:MAG: DMT family transporter, partial [Thermoanaerobaculales bacterium]|nr:DMT family transporter [Thermoanaerobaculales bacterium]
MPTAARFAVLAACFLWAVSFIATKIALETTPPLLVVSLRLVISALCFAVWLGLERSPDRPRPDRLILRLFGLSLLGTGLHYGLQTLGLQYTTASNASLYAVTGPITIALFGAAFLGERLGPAKVVGIAVALIGVLVVMGLEDIAAFDWRGHLLGDLLVLISIAMWGLFTVFGKKLTDA